jgi:hypothetical protein
MESCGFKVMFGGGEISRDCVEPVLFTFHYLDEKYGRGDKTFQPTLVHRSDTVCGTTEPTIRKNY